MVGVDVDIFVYTPAEIERGLEARSPFVAAVFTDGVVVYNRDPSASAGNLRSRIKEPTMESRIRNGQVWMERAQNQLRIAEALMPSADDFASGICFHCQQAAEIALKAFLLFRGVRLDYTHSLQSLAAQCVREDPDFDSCTEAAAVLTAYYIDTRYATEGNGFFFQDREPAEARAASEHANQIVSLAQSKIPPRRDSREAPQEDL
jgi:HEPN domain-containing protein